MVRTLKCEACDERTPHKSIRKATGTFAALVCAVLMFLTGVFLFPIGLPLAARRVEAISSEEFPTPARRPANSRLDTASLQRRFGIRPPPWQGLVDLCIAEYAARQG